MATPAAGNPLQYDTAALNPNLKLAAIPFEPAKRVHTTTFLVMSEPTARNLGDANCRDSSLRSE